MKRLHSYILAQLARNLLLSMVALCTLFVLFDFFDRVDKLIADKASLIDIFLYIIYKIPQTANLMLPVASLVATLFTLGMLSKNSELTAMRAAGLPVIWIARPILAFGIFISLFSVFLNEVIVPPASRKVREVYEIDIRKKDQKGSFSQSDFWWRSKNNFYSVDTFDSKEKSLTNLSIFEVSPDFNIRRRINAEVVNWINSTYRWSMKGISDYQFSSEQEVDIKKYGALPLLLDQEPEDFYDLRTDASTMSFRELKKFIKEQRANGIPVTQYFADLYEKLSFPFINFIVMLVILPFCVKSARSGSLALSFVAGIAITFTYYAVHSLSIALGRAELVHPMLAAWIANMLFLFVGLVLNLGAEDPL